MRALALSLALLLGVSAIRGAQIPLLPPKQPGYPDVSGRLEDDTTRWDLSAKPSANCTSHLIFDTVASLLQLWPNTRYRNGHNIVPGTIPVGALLYHGTYKNEIPSVPDWLATDPEHSRFFCRGGSDGCWQLTLAVKRPLKVLYFDGSSAAKIQGGPMDAQDLVGWGEYKPEWTFNERKRIDDLCEWGKQYRLDGFVRMEVNFEIMLCDFTVGVEVVSFLNLVPSGPHWRRHTLPPPPPSNPDFSARIKVLESGSWHRDFPGETKIHIDYTRLISFYDTALFPSLAGDREGQERLEHRLANMSTSDIQTLHRKLRDVLIDFPPTGSPARWSGLDWQNLFQNTVNRFSDRLEVLQHILNRTESTGALAAAKQAHFVLSNVVSPYTLHGVAPNGSVVGRSTDRAWARPIYRYCATTHTLFLEKLHAVEPTILTASEHLMWKALEDTNTEICRNAVSMWAEGVELGLSVQPEMPLLEVDLSEVADALARWKAQIDQLMGWLDWSVWVKCNPACSSEEICYLPTWPWFRRSPFPRGPQPQPGDDDEDEEEWRRPQPRCVRRLEPFVW